jgi:hypothetical protein
MDSELERDASRHALGEKLRVRLGLVHARSLRLAALWRLALAAIPVWVQAHTGILPGLLSWFACLFLGFAWAVAAIYATLEHYWTRRSARVDADAQPIHVLWSRRDEVCSGVAYGLGVLSLVPWSAVALGGRIPPATLQPLTLLALALAATWARLVARGLRSRPPGAERPGAPPGFRG